MIAVCAWCGTVLGSRGTEPGVTHGICPDCKARIVREYRLERLGREDRGIDQDVEDVEGGGATEGKQGCGEIRSTDPGRNLRVDREAIRRKP